MDIQGYSRVAINFTLESVHNDQLYACLGLISELGEVADKIKKQIRDNGGIFTEVFKNNIAYELGDCFWYINSICHISQLKLRNEAFDIAIGDNVNYSCRMAAYMIMQAASLLQFDVMKTETDSLIEQKTIDNIIQTLCEICHMIQIPVGLILQLNIDKLTNRKNTNNLGGSGDNR